MSRLPPEMLVNGRDDELFNKVKLSFDLPVDEAAARLGVCTTVLKKICRRKGINRWPFRKVSQPRFCRCLLPSMIAYWLQLSSLTGKIVACRARVNVSHGPTRERLESKIKHLDEEKRKILSGLHLGEHDLNFTSKGKAGPSACSPTANENPPHDLGVDGAGDAAKDLDTDEDKDLGRLFAEPGLASWRADETGRFPLPQGFPTAEPSMLVPASSFATAVRPAPHGESVNTRPCPSCRPFSFLCIYLLTMSIHRRISTRMSTAGFEMPDHLDM